MILPPAMPLKQACGRSSSRCVRTTGLSAPGFFSLRTIVMATESSPAALRSVCWYFWSIAKTMSGVASCRMRCVRAVGDSRRPRSRSLGRTVSPVSPAVARNCLSKSVRSVTTTTLKCFRCSFARILRTRNTILRLFPEPCVCQMMPPRSSVGAPWRRVRPSSSLVTARCTARNCW